MAFWDSSAIVPLCVHQPSAGRMRRLTVQHSRFVVWWGSSVEVRGALARLTWEGTIDSSALTQAQDRLMTLRRSWTEIEPTQGVRGIAELLPERINLRAADAFQLAAALVWCNERPRNRPFITIDHRLAVAASKIGFLVLGA